MTLKRVPFKVSAEMIEAEANGRTVTLEMSLKPYMIAQGPPRLFESAALMALPDPEWLIQYMVPKGDQVMLAAAEATGKTSLLFEWAWHIAQGRDEWHGYEIDADPERPVLYVVTEGYTQPGGIARGIMRKYDDMYPDNMHLSLDPVSVGRDGHLDQEVLDQWLETVGQFNYQLIVVDTLNRTAGGLEENSSGDMAEYIKFWETLQNRISHTHGGQRPTLMITHHVTKDSGGPRGSSALAASVDTIIQLTLDESGGVPVTDVKCRKQKAAKAFKPWRFSLDWDGEFNDRDPVIGVVSEGSPSKKEPAGVMARDEILQYILANPGASKNNMQRDLKKNFYTVTDALASLLDDKLVEERYDGWHAT